MGFLRHRLRVQRGEVVLLVINVGKLGSLCNILFFHSIRNLRCYVGGPTGSVEWILGSECGNLQGMYGGVILVRENSCVMYICICLTGRNVWRYHAREI